MFDPSLLSFVRLRDEDGYTNIFEDDLRLIWNRLLREKQVQHIFYDASVQSANMFIQFALADEVEFVAVEYKKEVVGFFWLTNIIGKTAQCHYTFFNCPDKRYSIPIGKMILNLLLEMCDDEGEYLLETIFGVTPLPYELGNKYAKKIGMNHICAVPGMCYLAYEGKYVDGNLYMITREKE